MAYSSSSLSEVELSSSLDSFLAFKARDLLLIIEKLQSEIEEERLAKEELRVFLSMFAKRVRSRHAEILRSHNMLETTINEYGKYTRQRMTGSDTKRSSIIVFTIEEINESIREKLDFIKFYNECPYSSKVWKLVRHLADMELVPRFFMILCSSICLWAKYGERLEAFVVKLILAQYFLFVSGLERNNRLFKNVKRTPEELRDVIMVTVRLKLLSFKFKNSANVISLLDRWMYSPDPLAIMCAFPLFMMCMSYVWLIELSAWKFAKENWDVF
ncbi:hypothetical protein Tco_1070837 [Tanacetum coccineum]|uniref:Uncharacterized protein n=1 Tax=Tanacetum coccineum TaxID=301880 RepID=A0ABQ5HMJ9_9ASTR